METSGVPFLVKLLQRSMLLQSALNIARAVPIFVFEFYPQMICVFICLFALSVGKHGMRTFGVKALTIYWISMIIACVCDVIAWLIGYVQLKRGYSSSEYAWGSFWTYTALLIVLIIANVVGLVTAIKLINRMKNFTLQERLIFLRLQAGDMKSDSGSASDGPAFRSIAVRPSCCVENAPANAAAVSPVAEIEMSAPVVVSNDSTVETQSNLDQAILKFDSGVFVENAVHKAKYNFVTFLPLFLYNQFSRLANLYTLGVVCLCFFSFSPLSPAASLLPLLIVLVTSAIREIFEDHKRKMQDRDVNMRQTEALRPESVSDSVGVFRKQVCQFQSCCWQDLKVGDIVRIHRDQYFPSDLVLLSCSTDTGRCYVETSQLDGESNFKLRFALKDTAALTDAESLCGYQYEVQCERPNSNLYVFDGTLKLTQLSTLQTSNIPISAEQMLLRGTKLKHNDWCIGLVINTGLDTKIEQNSTATPHKESRMERGINTKFVFIFLLQTALCLTCSLGYNKFRLRFSSNGPALPIYLRATENEDNSNQFIYGSYVILFNSMIPLSMYVTMEVVRFFNAQLIANHPRMRVLKSAPGSSDVSSAEGPIKEEDMYITSQSRNTSVVEELGQIRYIFSDKTGTLTRNQMILAQCSVAGVMFGSPVVNDIEPNVPPVSEQTTVEIDKQPSTRSAKVSGKASSDTSAASKPRLSRGVSMFEDADSAGVFMKHFSGLNDDDSAEGEEELDFEGGGNDERSSNEFCDQRLVDMAQYNSKADNEMTVDDVKEYQAAASVAREFLLSLALCNTVVPSKGQRDNEIVYQAGSPDEAALVEGARRLNVILQSRQDTRVTISYLDTIECYDVLGLFEFTSDRKRMSVILRGPFAADASGAADVINAAPVRLYCKGADNIILKRLSDENPLPCTCSELVQQHLGDMSSSGLRTLCFAARTLSAEEATNFSREFHEASMSLTHRRDMLEKVAEQYERDLEFIGITAIEDRLQEHVPYCLQKLREAGIKVCVCTGDKLETAVSIGYSSGLLLPHFELVRIEATDPAGMDQALNGIIERYRIHFNSNPTLWDQLRAFYTSDTELDRNAYSALPTTPFAIVIDGPSLSLALQAEHSDKFLSVLRAAVSAICCRCSPLQKASVVDLVKKAGVAMDDDFITLAVGDGANDCPMILKAHVGVGISDGKEGMAAVLASDFSIPRFAMLTRLLLVHGSHTYSRMSKLILFSFAKNIALALPNFWFAFVNGYSGQSLYWDFLFTWFNAVFTTAPIMTLAFTDEHASDRALLRFPGLYKNGMNNQSFGWPNFLGWLLVGTWVSMCVYAFGLWIPQVAEVGPSGHTGGIWFAGVTGYGVLIFALTIQVSLFTATRNRFRKANLLSLIASPIIFFGFVSIYSALTTLYPDSAFIAYQLFTIPAFWLVLPVGTITALLPNATLKTIKHLWFPKAHHILNQVMLAHNDMTHAMESAYKEQQRSRVRRMPSSQNLGVNRQLSRRLTRMGSSFAMHNIAEHDADIGEEIVPVTASNMSSKSSKRASSPVPEIAVAAAAAAESRDYFHAYEHAGDAVKPALIRDATRARIDIESWAGGVHALDDHHDVAPPNLVRTFSLMHRDTMSGFAFSQESGHGVLVNDRNREAALKRRATRQAARANDHTHIKPQ